MHRAFISYSSLDRAVAERLCASLEAAGTACWIAPRDIVPSREWAEQIIGGINQASAMLLVFSSRSNASPQVRREVERAVHKGVPVIPLRIENVLPTRSLEYFLSAQHWLDVEDQPVERWVPSLGRLIAQFEAERAERVVEPERGADDDPTDTAFQPSAFAQWAPSAPAALQPPSPAPPGARQIAPPADAVAVLGPLLSEYLGPVGSVLLARARQRHAEPAALVAALAAQLDVPAERAAFLERARRALRLP